MLVRSSERRLTGKARCDSRSPMLLPSATTTSDFANEADVHHLSAVIVDLERLADQIAAAFGRLIEQALVFQHLAEDHPEHALMTRVGHGLDDRPPFLDELGVAARVFSGE